MAKKALGSKLPNEVESIDEEADLSSIDKVAQSFGSYNFNEHDVCLNPDVPHSYQSKHIYWRIEIARTSKGFVFGYQANRLGADVGCGVSSSGAHASGSFFKTKPDAIQAAAKVIFQSLSSTNVKPFPKKELAGLELLIKGESPAKEVELPQQEQPFGSDSRWPGAAAAFQHWGVKDYDPTKFVELLHVLSGGLPFIAFWDNQVSNDPESVKTIINSPEFVAALRYKAHQLSMNETLAMSLIKNELERIPESEWKEHGQYGITGIYLQIQKLVLWWKEHPEFTLQPVAIKQSPNKKSTEMSTMLRMVPIASVKPSGTNMLQRESWELEEPALKELIDSIKEKGIIQPVLIRPNGTGETYYLVCGERRFKAAQFAGLDELPAFIREVSEDEAFDLQIIENLQRKDVHPMKEAQAYKALMDANPEKNTVKELAHRFAKSPEYITQRLSFNNLIPDLRKDFIAGKMLIGHAVLFARLQEADQRECLVGCKEKYGPSEGQYQSVKWVNDFIEQKVIREIKKAAFNPNDAELLPTAGSCHACPHRTGNAPELFPDIKDKDRCFKPECFALKTSTFLIKKVDEMRDENPTMAVISSDYTASPDSAVKKHLQKNGLKVLKQYGDYQDAARTDKGAIKALVVAGSEIGETKWIKLNPEKEKENTVSSAKGPTAKNTPEHYDEMIQQEKKKYEMAIEEAEEELQQELKNRVTDLKPFQEPDDTPLSKEELALFYMILCPSGHKKVQAILNALPVDKKLSKEEKQVEQFLAAPQHLINYIVRDTIGNNSYNLDEPNHPDGIAFRKAYQGWKGADFAKLQEEKDAKISAAKSTFDKLKKDYQEKKAQLVKEPGTKAPKKKDK